MHTGKDVAVVRIIVLLFSAILKTTVQTRNLDRLGIL